MENTQIALFIVASLAVILTPGQDFLLVLSRAVSQGPKAGVITASGVSVGLLGHSLLAAFGLGAILLSSSSLFFFLKCLGAGYLFYLGLGMIAGNGRKLQLGKEENKTSRRLFVTGAFSNLSNPHVTLFYFAFLPQFLSADIENPAFHLLLLGVSFSLLTFAIKGPLGYFAGALSSRLTANPAIVLFFNRLSGAIFIGLAVKLLVGSQK